MDDKPSQALAPGPLEVLDVARHRRGQEGRCRRRRFARQYRRADGDGEVQSEDLAGIERPAIAALWPTLAGRIRSCSIVGASIGADADASCRSGGDGRRDGARPVRSSNGRPSGCSISASRRSRASNRCAMPAACCAMQQLPDIDYHRLCRGRRYRQRHGRRGRHRGLCRQHCAEDRRRHCPADGGYLRSAMSRTLRAHRLPVRALGVSAAARQDGPPQVNGGVLLGLNGIVIKSHGGTDAEASPRRSTWATTWRATNCSPKLPELGRQARPGASVGGAAS